MEMITVNNCSSILKMKILQSFSLMQIVASKLIKKKLETFRADIIAKESGARVNGRFAVERIPAETAKATVTQILIVKEIWCAESIIVNIFTETCPNITLTVVFLIP